MTRWKWQNRLKFDEAERRPISGRHYPARSGLLVVSDITRSTAAARQGRPAVIGSVLMRVVRAKYANYLHSS